MTKLVLVDVLYEGLPEQVVSEQAELEQADLEQVALEQVGWDQQDWLGQVGLEQVHQDQQGWDLQVLVDLPFLRTLNLTYLFWNMSIYLFPLILSFSIV